jgi:glycogen phosphorylase
VLVHVWYREFDSPSLLIVVLPACCFEVAWLSDSMDVTQAILAKQRAETLSSVLYPDDRTYEGKELRLKQQHFFVSATLQDVVRRFMEANGEAWDLFAEKVAFQLNDTHPTIAIPELMRLLMDHHGLGWTQSWKITTQVCFSELVPRRS